MTISLPMILIGDMLGVEPVDRDTLLRWSDDMLKALGQEAQQLRADKADRATLAALFTEMALRLTVDFELPGGEDSRR